MNQPPPQRALSRHGRFSWEPQTTNGFKHRWLICFHHASYATPRADRGGTRKHPPPTRRAASSCGFAKNTRLLARPIDSLVRVSRRAGDGPATPSLAARSTVPRPGSDRRTKTTTSVAQSSYISRSTTRGTRDRRARRRTGHGTCSPASTRISARGRETQGPEQIWPVRRTHTKCTRIPPLCSTRGDRSSFVRCSLSHPRAQAGGVPPRAATIRPKPRQRALRPAAGRPEVAWSRVAAAPSARWPVAGPRAAGAAPTAPARRGALREEHGRGARGARQRNHPPPVPLQLQVLLTLFAEFFAPFDHSTCTLSVPCRYSAL